LLNLKNSFIKEFPDKTQTVVGRITQRSTGRQKQARFLQVGKLLAKERSRFKRNSFFAFAACELGRYSPIQLYCPLANEPVASIKI
jgi:hypothetical protein